MRATLAVMIVLLFAPDALASTCPAAVSRTDDQVVYAEIDSAPPNYEYNDADIEAAIDACGSTENCTVMLREATYYDVEIVIDDSVGNGFRIDCEAPRSCVLKHTIGFDDPIIRVDSNRSGIQLANFACDGLKELQTGTTQGSADASRCVDVLSQALRSSDDGWVDNIHAYDLKDGVMIRNGKRWAVTNSLFERMGCNMYDEPCSDDWNGLVPAYSDDSTPHTSVQGFGINVRGLNYAGIGPDGVCIEGNEVRSATKVAIGVWSDEDYGMDGEVVGGVIRDNRVERAGQSGISVGYNVKSFEILDNVVVHSGGYDEGPDPEDQGSRDYQGKGIGCGGVPSQGIVVTGNTISGAWTRGITQSIGCEVPEGQNVVRGECMGPGCPAEDTDGDTIPDYFDNCTYVANGPNNSSNQIDSDGDGFGNACDYDFMQFGKLAEGDDWETNIAWLQFAIDQGAAPTAGLASMDMNGSDTINSLDRFLAEEGRLRHQSASDIMVSGLEGEEIGDCADPTLRTGTSFPWYPVGIDDPCPARTPWWSW